VSGARDTPNPLSLRALAASLGLLFGFSGVPAVGAYAQGGGNAPAPADAPPISGQPQGHQAAPTTDLEPFQVNGQVNVIAQTVGRFRSPYAGPNSFLARRESEASETYTLFFGSRLRPNFELYADGELAAGKGLSSAFGIAGFVNNDVIRNPTLSQEPYLSRYFVRYTISLGKGVQTVEGSQNQVAGMLPSDRLVISAGKVSVPDFFDVNSYASSSHTSFVDWVLVNTGAWDYPADTRGYTRGVVVESIHPAYAVRVGLFQMPSVANGINLASRIDINRGDNLEVELHPVIFRKLVAPLVLRLLAYRNLARMGSYAESIAQARAMGGAVPVIQDTAKDARRKVGYGLNFEQSLGDKGNTGIFGRYSSDDGKTESFAYTEVDRHLSGGIQLSGAHFLHRPNDHVALAFAQNQLSNDHRDYLAAGGLGFLLGDGQLNYGPERILEAYYSYSLTKGVTLSPEFQHIVNPGYNRDRGPINVTGIRFHAEF
jgi:high affinity Mn2+ porin